MLKFEHNQCVQTLKINPVKDYENRPFKNSTRP